MSTLDRNTHGIVVTYLLVLGLGVVATHCDTRPAHAQDDDAADIDSAIDEDASVDEDGNDRDVTPPPVDDTEDVATVLTRVAYGESLHDRVALWYVLQRRAALAGVSIDRMAVRYVSALRAGLKREPRRQWVRRIDADCARPDGLPAREVWSVEICQRVRADGVAFLHGGLVDPCPRAMHWGSRDARFTDHRRAVRAHWRLAACSAGMQNELWLGAR